MARKTPEIDTHSPQYQELADYLERILAQDQKFQGRPIFMTLKFTLSLTEILLSMRSTASLLRIRPEITSRF